MEMIPTKEPLLQAIQKMVDFKTFRRFCKKYGLLVFGTWLSDALLSDSDKETEKEGVVFWAYQVREDFLRDLWEEWKPRIEALQEDIKNLAKYQDTNPKRYAGILDKGFQEIKGRSSYKKDRPGIALLITPRNLQAAISLQVGLDGVAICDKPGCGIVFATNRTDKSYCNPNHHPTTATDLRKAKARARRKLYYKWETDPKRAKAIDADVKRELKKADTEEAVKAVEEKFKLASRPKKRGT